MTSEGGTATSPGLRYLVGAASFVVVVAGLREGSQLILPFLVAVFLAVVSVPFMRGLQRLGVPQALAVVSTILAAAGMITLLVLLLVQSANQFRFAAPRYQRRLTQLVDDASALLQDYGLPTSDFRSLDLLPVGLFDVVGLALGAVASFASNSFLVLLTVIFILMEAAGFSRKVRRAFGRRAELGQLERMAREVQNYIVTKTAISVATGTLVGIWCAGNGLDFPVLWGLIAFFLNFIPTLGSIISAVPAVLLALLQFGPGQAAVLAAGYLVVNVVFGSFLEPLLMGRRLGLSTLVVFSSLVFWGFVWGPVGMLFSVPLTMVLKIAFENTEDFRWIAVMLDANPAPRKKTAHVSGGPAGAGRVGA